MVISEIVQTVSELSIFTILFAFVISVVTIYFGSLIFQYIGKGFGQHITTKDSFTINYLALFVGYLVPFKPGSLALKVVITRLISKVELKYATLILVAENVFYFFWQIPLLIALLFLSGFSFVGFKSGGFISLIVFIILLITFILKPDIVLISKKIIPKKLLRKYSKIDSFIDSIGTSQRSFLQLKILVPIIIFSLILLFISPLFIKLADGVVTNQLSYLQAFTVFWISYVIGKISFFSDGFGVKDLALGALLLTYGLSSFDALQVVVLFRVFTILPILVIGGLFLIFTGKKIPLKQLIKKPHKV